MQHENSAIHQKPALFPENLQVHSHNAHTKLGDAHVEVWLNVYVNETVQMYQECKINDIPSL